MNRAEVIHPPNWPTQTNLAGFRFINEKPQPNDGEIKISVYLTLPNFTYKLERITFDMTK